MSSDDLRSQVTEQISYSVVGRGTVLLVFGLFFAALFVAVIVTPGMKAPVESETVPPKVALLV